MVTKLKKVQFKKLMLINTNLILRVLGLFRHTRVLFKSILTHIYILVYLCHIHNPGTFQSQNIFRLRGIFIIPR